VAQRFDTCPCGTALVNQPSSHSIDQRDTGSNKKTVHKHDQL